MKDLKRERSEAPGGEPHVAEARPAPPALLTVHEVARILGLHEKTVYEWVGRGRLPCIRLGNRLRFAPEDLTRWLRHRREGD